MSDLYQIAFGYQPNYVVAVSFADAEKTAKDAKYMPEKIECLGPYVLISKTVLEEEAEVRDGD